MKSGEGCEARVSLEDWAKLAIAAIDRGRFRPMGAPRADGFCAQRSEVRSGELAPASSVAESWHGGESSFEGFAADCLKAGVSAL